VVDLATLQHNDVNQYTNINGSVPEYDGRFNLYRFGGPQYDNRFNLHVFSGSQYDHDAASRLTSVSGNGHSASFTYDGLGRCVRRTIDNETRIFAYDGWNPICEWDQAGNWKAVNIYGAGSDEILGRYDAVRGPLIYKQDKQGNVLFVLDANNQIAEKYTYDAYGTPTILSTNNSQLSTSAIGNRFMYTEREWLGELGIYDYRHRYYLPSIGRFIQADPMGLQTEGAKLTPEQKALFSPGGVAPEAFTSSEMNLFRYCGDDPVDNSDPLGLKDEYDYPDSKDAAAARALIDRLIAMGGKIGARLQQIRDSNNRILFIPIQKDEAGWNKYNLPPRAKGDTTNRTTPDDEARSRGGRPGTGSKVELDPHNWRDPEGHRRDPIEAAGHEGDHAGANDEGKRLPQIDEENRAREFQMQIRRKLQEGK
jgi:RHS repeat-associated protein